MTDAELAVHSRDGEEELEECEWKGVVVPIRILGAGFKWYAKAARNLADNIALWVYCTIVTHLGAYLTMSTKASVFVINMVFYLTLAAALLYIFVQVAVLDYLRWRLVLQNWQNIYASVLAAVIFLLMTQLYDQNNNVGVTYTALIVLFLPHIFAVIEISSLPYAAYILFFPSMVLGWSAVLLKFYLDGVPGFAKTDKVLYKAGSTEIGVFNAVAYAGIFSMTLIVAKLGYFYDAVRGEPVRYTNGRRAKLTYHQYETDAFMKKPSTVMVVFTIHGLLFIGQVSVLLIRVFYL